MDISKIQAKHDRSIKRAYEFGKINEALKVLNKVNEMIKNNATIYEIQMYLFNNWAGKTNKADVFEEYEK